jgi:hypothetical protein
VDLNGHGLFLLASGRRDRLQLESELAATRQLLTAADSREHDRDNQLAQTLAIMAAEKRRIVTPAQIVRELPSQIPVPSPHRSTIRSGICKLAVAPTKAAIPAEDLRPLCDFTIDCKACEARLAAALRFASGSSLWRRIGRAVKWFLIGAAAGAVAAKTAH